MKPRRCTVCKVRIHPAADDPRKTFTNRTELPHCDSPVCKPCHAAKLAAGSKP